MDHHSVVLFCLTILGCLNGHDVVTGIHRNDGTGNPTRKFAAQKEGGLSNLIYGDVPFHGRFFSSRMLHVPKPADSSGCQGL